MKSIPTEIVDRPMLVQEVGGNRTWEAETTDPFCNVWHEVTGGKTDWSRPRKKRKGCNPPHLEFCG